MKRTICITIALLAAGAAMAQVRKPVTEMPATPAATSLSGASKTVQVAIPSILMSVSVPSIDFGVMPQGQMPSRQFTISNAANSRSTLNISFSNIASAFSISPATAAISAGGNQVFTVTYNPSAGSYDQPFNIINNSTNSAHVFPVALKGSVNNVQMAVSATSLDFGNVNLGSSATRTFTVSSGSGSNQILTISFSALSGAFHINTSEMYMNIQPGQGRQFTVTFSPSGIAQSGQNSAVLSITNNASDHQNHSISLSGVGQ